MPRKTLTPAERREAIDRKLVAQTQAAMDALPVIEQRARDRVADAEERLRVAQADLDHVLNVEIPVANGRPPMSKA